MTTRLKRVRQLGAYTDNPNELLDLAQMEISSILCSWSGTKAQQLAVRRAAELGHLAMSSTLDVIAEKNLESFGQEKTMLKELQAHAAPGLKNRYVDIRDVLHGLAFHQDKVGPNVVSDFLGRAHAMINELKCAGWAWRRG